jgi:hemolysin III
MYHGERFNAWSHLLGAVAAFIGAVWMLVVASMDGSPWKIVSVAIYGVTLLVLYSASTVYHSVRGRMRARFVGSGQGVQRDRQGGCQGPDPGALA